MKFITTPLLQFLLIFIVRSAKDVQVDATVGLYGPDRYEGLPEICLMPMEFGYCRAKVQRYYFDIRRMKCTMFFWGGCAGNDNNFKSIEECNQFCAAAYDDTNSVVPPKRERVDNTAANNNNYNSNVNTKYNALTSRGSSISKAAPKFTVKNNPASKETVPNGSIKASAKSFNVNTAPKTYNNRSTTENIEDEEYDD